MNLFALFRLLSAPPRLVSVEDIYVFQANESGYNSTIYTLGLDLPQTKLLQFNLSFDIGRTLILLLCLGKAELKMNNLSHIDAFGSLQEIFSCVVNDNKVLDQIWMSAQENLF